MNKKLRLALIGCGRIAKKHLTAVYDNKDIMELVAISDLIEENMDNAIKYYEELDPKHNIKKYKDYQNILNDKSIDIAVIITESGYHYKHALYFLENNVNVLVEKPITLDSNQAQHLIDIAEEKNLTLGVCHQNRFNEPIQLLREAVEKNQLGRVINITARILWNRNQGYYKQAPWRGTKELDGGTLMNQCIHAIDLLQWMAQSNVKSIKAERGTFLRDIEMEDFGAALVRFENNVIGIIEGTALTYPSNIEETLSIYGEKGTIVVGGIAVNKIDYWNVKDVPMPDLGYDIEVDSVYGHGHSLLYKDFVQALLSGETPLVDGVEGKKALDVVLGIYSESELLPKK